MEVSRFFTLHFSFSLIKIQVFAAPLTDDGREATDEDDLFIDEPSELARRLLIVRLV